MAGSMGSSEFTVCVNLTRLVEAAKGSGGAGWFGGEICKRLASRGDVRVLARAGNAGYVQSVLADVLRSGQARLDIVDGSLQDWLAGPSGEAIDVYIDPLNGLDPEVIPGHIASIAVIHDLMFMREPSVFTEDEIAFRCSHYGQAMQRADLVMTVAEREAEDIRKLFPGKPVVVVDQPAYFKGGASQERSQRAPVLFSPGVQWNHKNHFRLASAFLRLIDEGRIDPASRLCVSAVLPIEANHQLLKVLTGSSAYGDAIVQLPYLPREKFSAFIARCDGIVLPSLHEGYGIPLIEAVVTGKPILTARVPSVAALSAIPEFVKFIEDPRDEVCIADALADFLGHIPLAVPRPDLCPTADSFTNQLVDAVDAALAARRSRQGVTLPAKFSIKRRADRLTVMIRGGTIAGGPVDLSALEGVTVRLFGRDRPVAADYVSVATRWQAEHIQAIVMAHEILLSENRFVLVCDASQAGRLDPAQLQIVTQRLKAAHVTSRVRLADLGLKHEGHLHGAAALPSGLYDLNDLNLPFEASPSEILTAMEQAPMLNQPTARRALIIDPSLKNANGHHLTVATMLARSLKLNGFHVGLACNQAMTLHAVPGADELFKILSDYLYEQNGDIGLAQWEFHQASSLAGVSRNDLLFAFCATPTMLAALALQLAQIPEEQRPHVVIRFDRPEWRTPPTTLGYEEAFALVNSLGLRQNFSFTVESKGLQRCFEASSGEVFPIRFNFVAAADLQGSDLVEVESASADTLIVSYVGEAREEKGFQHLPAVLRSVLARIGDAKVRFRIQCGANAWNQTPAIMDARQELAELACQDSRFELLEGALPENEYLELIRDAHIVFLPYFPPQYRIRGSGVATEAAAVGTDMVVSHGLDIIATYPDAIVTESTDYSVSALADALVARIQAVAALTGDERLARRDKTGDDLQGFASSFLQDPVTVPSSVSRIALWIANDTRGEGSDAVYTSQIKYLKAQGYFVIQLAAPYPAMWRLQQPASFDATAFAAGGGVMLNFRTGPEIEHVMEKLANGGDVLAAFTAAWNLTTLPQLVERLIRHSKPDLVVMNYAHHDPIIRRLIAEGTPVIVETHDIQALQYAIQQNRSVDERQLALEMGLVGKADHIVSISKSEAEVFAMHCGASKVSWCMPFVTAPRVKLTNKWEHDLLFVGSAHHANLESLRWFLTKVYEPLLHPQGVSLAIVGDAGQRVDVGHLGARVTCPGRVPDLAEWYAKSAIAALPIVAGAGVPVKVIDAMTRGAPFVLTDFPAKAMGLDGHMPLASSPLEFAEQVLATLADPAERLRRSQAGLDFIAKSASRESYSATWSRILSGLGRDIRP